MHLRTAPPKDSSVRGEMASATQCPLLVEWSLVGQPRVGEHVVAYSETLDAAVVCYMSTHVHTVKARHQHSTTTLINARASEAAWQTPLWRLASGYAAQGSLGQKCG